MKYFLSRQKENMLKTGQNPLIFSLVFLICLSFIAIRPIQVSAQWVVTGGPVTTVETASVPQTVQTVKTTWWQNFTKMLQKAGSIAFQRTLASALNKIAYDTANYIGSGGQGQKPLFVTKSLGDYLVQIGDEAAGQYIETFVNNLNTETYEGCSAKLQSCREACLKTQNGEEETDVTKLTTCNTACDKGATACVAENKVNGEVTPSFNVCSPSSLEAKLKIGLGLVDQNRPQAPNCTASQMIKNWGDDIQKKLDSLKDPNYLDTFANIFDPRSNDLGVYFIAKSDMISQANTKKEVTGSDFVRSGGWLDVRNIAGELEGVPGEAQRAANAASQARQDALGKTTGDILVDAANVFLNQLYVSAFDNLLRSLAKKSGGSNSSSSSSSGDFQSDPNVTYGESALKEMTSTLLQPKFGVRADYNILSELAVCLDAKNPGPNDCVIDDKFMQAITEKKTVAEAVKDGYLHGDWQLTTENNQNNYSLRNISILRKYRILPVGWEEAVSKMVAQAKRVTLKDLISCFDYNDEYADFSSGFDQTDQGWCQGLVDPNWVLKAPLNYCKKEGIGAQIISSSVVPGSKGVNGTADILSSVNIVRSENYCADNQTCIKEKDDGSCEVYGYCNEEKRTWDFGTDSCAPISNTCQSFTSSSGQSVSYLENTLDYSDCNADNAGCRRYSISGSYASSTGTVAWDGVKSIYLNKNLSDCDNKLEGCTGLLRVKPAWGSNLVMNADFSNDQVGDTNQGNALNDWSLSNSQAAIVDMAQEIAGGSGKAIKLTSFSTSGGLYSSAARSLLPSNFQVIPGQAYTLSADVYLKEGDSVTMAMGAVADGFKQSTSSKDGWQRLTVTRQASSSYNEPSFSVIGFSASASGILYVKNIKFEVGDWGTSYSPYGSFKFYEKLLPSYLERSCYVDATSASKNYALKSDAPAVCSNYARRCNKDEVDCESYRSVEDNFVVPAKVVSSDYCPSECLGYDVYISQANHFNPATAENIIPAKATSCSASAAGCNEFTNLDELTQGGEKKEYYTSLKYCIKPDTASCASFYSWEGTANGYQLKAYSLKKGSDNSPEVTSDDSALCNSTVYHLPISDPAYNADCREFYNAAGGVSYHLASLTITCSDNCHAYRLSEKNVDKSLDQSECTGSDKHWNSGNNSCNVCLNGGVWNSIHSACVYQAIPGEGQTCQAAENGCRAYNGNSGSNVKLISYSDFESGLGSWHSNCQNGTSLSSVANSNNGHSLQYNSSVTCGNQIGSEAAAITRRPLIERIFAGDDMAAQLDVTKSVQQGAAYNVKFLARAASNVSLKIYFVNKDTQEKALFSSVMIKGGNDWNLYQANLENLNHPIGAVEVLAVSGNADFFLDNVILSEITDRYYLVKGSSRIPDICYYDVFDKYQGADYNLGCSQYTDRSNGKHNLHKFTKLCSESAVGCEQMIDTKNYTPYGPAFWENGTATTTCDVNDANCTSVGGDSAIYAVYDADKQCTSSGQGCSRLGQGQGGTNLTGWSDVFKQNNPDQYDNILCSKDNIGCEEWKNTDDNSLNYFKNPGTAVCSYRASRDPNTPGKSWYRIPVKRCDLNGNGSLKNEGAYLEQSGAICSVDKDCGTKKCLVDNNDYPCSFSYYKTIGLGGAGNQVQVPDKEVGLCEASTSGCTEYIDPVSQFVSNLVANPDYSPVNVTNGLREGWGSLTLDWGSINPNQQVVEIKPNKLYSLMTKKSAKEGNFLAGNVRIDFKNFVKPFLTDNTLGTSTKSLELVNGTNQPIIFDSLHNDSLLLTGGDELKTIEIKELVVGYKLSSSIDKKGCSGVAKFDNGCILFNERSVDGAGGLADLSQGGYDAFATVDGKSPTPCTASDPGSCTANTLIKVRPDRVCSRWLDCVTYTQDKDSKQRICYALGQCDRLDDTGECANFVSKTATGTLQFKDPQSGKNLSGYSLLNKYDLSNMKETGLNSEAHFDFEDSVPALNCKRNIDFIPDPSAPNCTFDADIAKDSLIRGPEGAPTDYPAHGRTYLKVPATYQISPQGPGNYITLEPPQSGSGSAAYYINYLINTKTSGLGTKLIIYADSKSNPNVTNNIVLRATHTGNDGWTRVVDKFYINSTNNKINIYLTSDANSSNLKESGFVYFDDINIEPVLETGPGQYVARECRLYPTEDSLTCLNNSSNTISDGLEGYCLQHDSFNASICQLWYPVDKISSSKGFSTALGYKSKFPLNYCSELNANFDFVEKRNAYYYLYTHNDSGLPEGGRIVKDLTPSEVVSQRVSAATAQQQPVGSYVDYNHPRFGSMRLKVLSYEDIDEYSLVSQRVSSSTARMYPIGSYVEYNLPGVGETMLQVHSYSDIYLSYDKTQYLKVMTTDKRQFLDVNIQTGLQSGKRGARQGCFIYPSNVRLWTSMYDILNGIDPMSCHGDPGYKPIISYTQASEDWGLSSENHYNVWCVPTDIKVVDGSYKIDHSGPCGGVIIDNGWAVYNDDLLNKAPLSGGVAVNEAENANPPIRIYDYEKAPTSVDGLNKISNSISEDVYRLACNKFIETVNSAGENKAWTWRTGKSASYATTTAPFLNYWDYNNYNYFGISGYGRDAAYGRNSESAPFGAAIWPTNYDLLSSDRIRLRDRYSKQDDQETFAGRPYGCAGRNCDSVGSCSGDPNIFCLLDEGQSAADKIVLNISSATCQGVGNACIPLWKTVPNKNVLQNIFLKSYNAYSFGGFGSGYISSTDMIDKVNDTTPPRCTATDAQGNIVRPADSNVSSFCTIYPKVKNLKLYYGDSTLSPPLGRPDKKNIYRLEFNTFVDSEQQPLRRIYIDWGDGSNQIITDQDQHPSNPHVFYHYYGQVGTQISVRVYDNWGKYNDPPASN
jgi:hypothetical protein